MANLCEDAERARKFRVLEQLERETKEFLLPALREAGGSGKEDPQRIAEGETLGTNIAKAPWADLMRGFEGELQRFVADFERAEAVAPAGKESLLRHVTAHERALLDFATRELKGSKDGDSLESVFALLRTPRLPSGSGISCGAERPHGMVLSRQRDHSGRGTSNRPGARRENDRSTGPSRENLFELPSQRCAAIRVKRCNVGRGGACPSE
jgi:hypothetical protein